MEKQLYKKIGLDFVSMKKYTKESTVWKEFNNISLVFMETNSEPNKHVQILETWRKLSKLS